MRCDLAIHGSSLDLAFARFVRAYSYWLVSIGRAGWDHIALVRWYHGVEAWGFGEALLDRLVLISLIKIDIQRLVELSIWLQLGELF